MAIGHAPRIRWGLVLAAVSPIPMLISLLAGQEGHAKGYWMNDVTPWISIGIFGVAAIEGLASPTARRSATTLALYAAVGLVLLLLARETGTLST